MRDYNVPDSFEHFLYVSQLLQAGGISLGMEAQRRNRDICMGSLYWQLNDCWPVASWSSIDYFGNGRHYIIIQKSHLKNPFYHFIKTIMR